MDGGPAAVCIIGKLNSNNKNELWCWGDLAAYQASLPTTRLCVATCPDLRVQFCISQERELISNEAAETFRKSVLYIYFVDILSVHTSTSI